PLTPDEPTTLVFDLLPTSYRFARGHAVRIAIAAADVDHFARIPREGPSTLRVYRGGANASRIDLPRVPAYPRHLLASSASRSPSSSHGVLLASPGLAGSTLASRRPLPRCRARSMAGPASTSGRTKEDAVPATWYRTIWLSDVHLGTRGSKAQALL